MILITGLLWIEDKAGCWCDAAEAALGRIWRRHTPQARMRKALAEAVRKAQDVDACDACGACGNVAPASASSYRMICAECHARGAK